MTGELGTACPAYNESTMWVFPGMATMLPTDKPIFNTDGEGAFFRFQQAIAVPDSSCIAWYQAGYHGT